MRGRQQAAGIGHGGQVVTLRRRLLNGASGPALLAISAGLALGVAFSPEARAQGVMISPVQSTTYTLGPGTNPITFGSGTNINAAVYPNAVYGNNTSTNWTVTNHGTLQGAVYGLNLQQKGTVTNSGTTTATGGIAGLMLGAGGILNNTGTVSGDRQGVLIAGGAGTVTNSGMIAGTAAVGVGVALRAGGTVDNQAGGMITGAVNGVYLQAGGAVTNETGATISGIHGVYAKTVATVTNAGTITGTSESVYFAGGGSITNQAGGTISGSNGVHIVNAAGTVTNGGTITGTNESVLLSHGGSVTNQQGGTINGLYGVVVRAAAGTVTNAGTITATGNAGIFFDTGGVVVNQTGGTVNGRGYGIAIGGTAGTVTNYGSIASTGTINGVGVGIGVALTAGGSVTNHAGATITGGKYGVYVTGGSAATVVNSGTITAAATSAFGNTPTTVGVSLLNGGGVTNLAGGYISGANGVSIANASGTVINGGTITGTGKSGVALFAGGAVANLNGVITGAQYGVYLGAGSTVTNAGTASITGGTVGILANGATTVNNAGTITGTNLIGVFLAAGGNVLNASGATISGGAYGIFSSGTAVVSNGGVITGGVFLAAGGLVVNQASGTIGGGKYGAAFYGAAGTVTNAGTITGTTASVQFAGTGANVLTLQTGSMLVGDAIGSTAAGATNALILQGTGAANNNFLNFNTLDVQAQGVWTLNGVSAIPTTTVTSGDLRIGDATHASAQLTSAVTVNAGGTLSGHGGILGAVTNAGGTIAPGGSIGTLTVANFRQTSAGTLQVEVSPAAASQLKVTGAANLNGTLALVFDPGVYNAKSYALLTASSVAGNFATVTGTVPTAGITQAVTIGASEVDLILSNTPTPIISSTPTPIVIAPVNATLPTSAATTVIDSAHQVAGTLFDHLRQNRAGGDVQATLAGTRPTQLALIGSNAELGSLVAALPDTLAQYGGWVRATGNFSATGSEPGTPGFDSQGGGFLAGIDHKFTENLILGIAAGYTHTALQEQTGANSAIETPRVTLYGSYAPGPVVFDALVGYGHDGFVNTRLTPAGIAASRHDGHEVAAATQASRRFSIDGYGLTPQAGLQWTHLSETGFGENGAGGFDLAVASHDTDSLRPFIGAALDRTFSTDSGTRITPEVRLGYSREVLSTGRTINVTTASAAAFLVNGISPSRDQVTAGAGVIVQAAQTLDLFVDYDYAPLTGNQTSQTVSAGLRYRF